MSVADPEFTVLNCFSYFTFFCLFVFKRCTGSLCSISENKRGKGVCTSLSHNGSAAAESHVNPSVNTPGQGSHTREGTVTQLGDLVPLTYSLFMKIIPRFISFTMKHLPTSCLKLLASCFMFTLQELTQTEIL